MAEDLAEGHPAQPEEGAERLTEELLARGWHPDPFERFPFRHWDGDAWTSYAADAAGEVRWDPEPIDPLVEHGPGLPGIGIAIAGYVVGVGLSFVVIKVVHLSRPAELALSSLALWSGLLGAALYVSRRRGTGSFVRDYSLRFRWIDLGFGLAGSVAGRLAASTAVSPIPLPHRKLGSGDRTVFHGATTSATAWVVVIVVVCIGAPIVEEIFFRGLLQARLIGRHGPVVGIGVASVLFGAAHLIAWSGPLTLAYAWAVAAGGLVLGTTFFLTRRLGTSMLAHAMFNAQALLAVALLT